MKPDPWDPSAPWELQRRPLEAGDLVLVPHGGERIGKVLARVTGCDRAAVGVLLWSPRRNDWHGWRVVDPSDCAPAPETDRRVKAAKKATP